jgi:hypothetical protein
MRVGSPDVEAASPNLSCPNPTVPLTRQYGCCEVMAVLAKGLGIRVAPTL